MHPEDCICEHLILIHEDHCHRHRHCYMQTAKVANFLTFVFPNNQHQQVANLLTFVSFLKK